MYKIIGGFFAAVILLGVLGWNYAGGLMVRETPSPFGLKETAARIQANIEAAGWNLSGLRSPSNSIRNLGGYVPPVLLVEACKPDYSKPILKEDQTRILSILMPCTITVYEKEDGKVYIGTMNTGLMGWMFGYDVAQVMQDVAADQKKFLTFDASKPAPPLKIIGPSAGKKDGGGGAIGGC